MKKIFLTLLALLSFVVCSAQLKTYSNYDANGDGKVDISDVTATVNKVLGKVSDDQVLVQGRSLAIWLSKIEDYLDIRHDPRYSLENMMGVIERTLAYNGHAYVDLGLPSGLKWATCNIGANSPEEYGSYFAWAATETQKDYNWSNTPYQTQKTTSSSSTKFTKYLGSTTSSYKDPSATDADALKTVLDKDDDAAHVNWGGAWRMPTEGEQDELRNNCYWVWVTSYNGKSVKGYIVYKAKDARDKGKYSSGYTPVGSYSVSDTHIFLPATGYRIDTSNPGSGSYGNYYSSTVNSDVSACIIHFGKDDVRWGSSNRELGMSVRAVCK